MARLTQKSLDDAFARGGSATSAYEAARGRQQESSESQLGRDAALRNLVTGKQLDLSNDQAKAASDLENVGTLREKYGPEVDVGSGSARVGGQMSMLEKWLKQKQLSQPTLTPGQEAADKAFGKEYSDYIAGGGSKMAEKNLGLLQNVEKQLSAPNAKAPNFLERGVQYLPDAARAALTPDIKAQEDAVRTAVQSSLRQTLGAQFTEKEGEGLMRRAYDPRLSPQQNLAKMLPEIEALKNQIKQKTQSAQQFERTGSLVGLGAASAQPQQVAPTPAQAPMSFEEWKRAKAGR